MKKVVGLFVALGFLFQSCVTTEEMSVKKEGSIEYTLDMDFSELLKAMPMENTSSKEMKKALDLLNGEELTIEQILDSSLLDSKNAEQKKDSILKANPDLLKKTENLRLRVMMNDSVGNIALKVLAKNATDLNVSLENLETLSALGESNAKKMEAPEFIRKSKFEWKKKAFKRTIDVKPEELQKGLGDLGQMAAMFTYRIKVHVEQPIKSVSYQDAVMAKDGKSFVKTFKMSDSVANPKLLEFTVELK